MCFELFRELNMFFETRLVNMFFKRKGQFIPPTIYLGNKVSKVTLENGIDVW